VRSEGSEISTRTFNYSSLFFTFPRSCSCSTQYARLNNPLRLQPPRVLSFNFAKNTELDSLIHLEPPSFVPSLLPFTFMHLSHLLSLSFLLPALATARPSSLAQSEVPASLQDLELEPSNDFYRYANKVYLLRHGEKSSDGETGLNSKGKKRAKCLKKVSTILGELPPETPIADTVPHYS